ncbi:hypothetical protein LY78DRAFT_308737 [Colletotrichum sublineola]|nr:hypothetical protein LY78DRAFT_308737 [Colletotrichum sublineola]
MTDHPWWQRDLNIISEAWSAQALRTPFRARGGFPASASSTSHLCLVPFSMFFATCVGSFKTARPCDLVRTSSSWPFLQLPKCLFSSLVHLDLVNITQSLPVWRGKLADIGCETAV